MLCDVWQTSSSHVVTPPAAGHSSHRRKAPRNLPPNDAAAERSHRRSALTLSCSLRALLVTESFTVFDFACACIAGVRESCRSPPHSQPTAKMRLITRGSRHEFNFSIQAHVFRELSRRGFICTPKSAARTCGLEEGGQSALKSHGSASRRESVCFSGCWDNLHCARRATAKKF